MKFSAESSSKKLAQALALQVGEVQKRFGKNRRALRTVPGPGGKPAYLRQEVAGLIARTGEDLDQAIEKVQPSERSLCAPGRPRSSGASRESSRRRRAGPPPRSPASSPPAPSPGSPASRGSRCWRSRARTLPEAGCLEAAPKPAPRRPLPRSRTRSPPRRPTGSWTRWGRWSAGSSSSPITTTSR